jgi:hypothetical protein
MLSRLDFEVAIKFEREIYIQPPELFAFMSRALPGISPAPAYLSPLMASPGTFSQNQETMSHSIAVSTAEILDDISFLVSAITSSPPAPTPKIRGTASWLHSCLQKIDLPTKPTTDDEVVLSVIRHTAIIYTESISTLTPLSYSYSKSLLSELYAHLTFFQPSALRRWNGLPGIFLWILLVACPSSGNDPMGRSLRSKMAATRIVLGLEDYNLPFAYLSSFWRVQRWIDKEREDGELETDALLQSVPEDEP